VGSQPNTHKHILLAFQTSVFVCSFTSLEVFIVMNIKKRVALEGLRHAAFKKHKAFKKKLFIETLKSLLKG